MFVIYGLFTGMTSFTGGIIAGVVALLAEEEEAVLVAEIGVEIVAGVVGVDEDVLFSRLVPLLDFLIEDDEPAEEGERVFLSKVGVVDFC